MTQLNLKVEVHRLTVEMKIKPHSDGSWHNWGKPIYINTTLASIPKEIENSIASGKFFVKSIEPTRPTIIARIISGWSIVCIALRNLKTDLCSYNFFITEGAESMWSILNWLDDNNSKDSYSSIISSHNSRVINLSYKDRPYNSFGLKAQDRDRLVKETPFLIFDLEKKHSLTNIHYWSYSKSNFDGTPIAWASNAQYLVSKDFNLIHVISEKAKKIYDQPAKTYSPKKFIWTMIPLLSLAGYALAQIVDTPRPSLDQVTASSNNIPNLQEKAPDPDPEQKNLEEFAKNAKILDKIIEDTQSSRELVPHEVIVSSLQEILMSSKSLTDISNKELNELEQLEKDYQIQQAQELKNDISQYQASNQLSNTNGLIDNQTRDSIQSSLSERIKQIERGGKVFGDFKSTRYTVCSLVEKFNPSHRPIIASLITQILEEPNLPKKDAINPKYFKNSTEKNRLKYAIEWANAIYKYQEKQNIKADGIVNYGGTTIRKLENDLKNKLLQNPEFKHLASNLTTH